MLVEANIGATSQGAVESGAGGDLAVIEALVRSLVKALRAVQLYLPNNPMYEQALKHVTTAFEEAWRVTTELPLEINDTEIIWQENAVYSQPTKSESVAWMLYKDGVRGVKFYPGVEQDEIVRFLVVVNRVRTLPPDGEDDLLTLLWEEDFKHLRYSAIEVQDDDAGVIERSSDEAAPPAESVRREVQQEVAEAAHNFVAVDDFDAGLYRLEPEEVAYLKAELAREYGQDLRPNVLAILFDIFEAQKDPAVRTEVIEIMNQFVPHLLAAGDPTSVMYVLRESQVIRKRAEELGAQHARALEELPARLSDPETFGRLMQALEDGGEALNDEELEHLFAGLRPTVFQSALEWLPRVSKRMRSLLEDALLKMAIANPEVLTSALGADETDVVRMAVRFARTLALPSVVPHLGRLFEHPDAQLRAEVVKVLDVYGTPDSMNALELALEDQNREIRIAAVRGLASHGHGHVLSRLEPMVVEGGLKDADLTEKKAFFEAYGVLAGPSGIEQLMTMLLPRGFMRRKEDPQTRACAAMALGTIGTDEALHALKQAQNDKDPLVRNAVNQAIREHAGK